MSRAGGGSRGRSELPERLQSPWRSGCRQRSTQQRRHGASRLPCVSFICVFARTCTREDMCALVHFEYAHVFADMYIHVHVCYVPCR